MNRNEKLRQKKEKRIRNKEKKIEQRELSVKNLDNLWQQATKIIANNKCIKCGKNTNIQSHHIIGRRNFSVRWDIDNCVVLCANHHTFDRYFSAHTTPIEFNNWIVEKRGLSWYQRLKQNSLEPLTYQRKKDYYNKLLLIIKTYENNKKI